MYIVCSNVVVQLFGWGWCAQFSCQGSLTLTGKLI